MAKGVYRYQTDLFEERLERHAMRALLSDPNDMHGPAHRSLCTYSPFLTLPRPHGRGLIYEQPLLVQEAPRRLRATLQ